MAPTNSSKPCKFFAKNATCRKGSRCGYSHIGPVTGAKTSSKTLRLDLPNNMQWADATDNDDWIAHGREKLEKEEKKTRVCAHYMKNKCIRGDRCDFYHPPKNDAATDMDVRSESGSQVSTPSTRGSTSCESPEDQVAEDAAGVSDDSENCSFTWDDAELERLDADRFGIWSECRVPKGTRWADARRTDDADIIALCSALMERRSH